MLQQKLLGDNLFSTEVASISVIEGAVFLTTLHSE